MGGARASCALGCGVADGDDLAHYAVCPVPQQSFAVGFPLAGAWPNAAGYPAMIQVPGPASAEQLAVSLMLAEAAVGAILHFRRETDRGERVIEYLRARVRRLLSWSGQLRAAMRNA